MGATPPPPERMPGSSPGPGVDIAGTPVVDPTKNVLDLVAARGERQDDLLAAAVKRIDDLRNAETARLRELSNVRHEHVQSLAELRADYEDKLRVAEAARIDSIRAVDVAAVQRAAEVASAQAATLATQNATLAETLRVQLAATATAFAASQQQALEPMRKDISDLRTAKDQTVGAKVQTSETGGTHRENMGLAIAATGIVGSVIIGVSGIVVGLIFKGG